MKSARYLIFVVYFIITAPLQAQQPISKSSFESIQASLNLAPDDLIYVDFWASWCTPCRKSFPWMNKMYDKYEAQGLHIVAVNVDTDRALAEDFLKKQPANFKVIYDPKGKLAEAFHVMGMPSSFLLTPQGKTLSTHKGFFLSQTQAYEAELIDLLAKNQQTATKE